MKTLSVTRRLVLTTGIAIGTLAVASSAFLRLGADTGRTGPITAGRRSGTLHGLLGDHRLTPGDLLHMELVPSVNGYSARLMRPTVIGPPSSEQAETAAQLIEIQDEQIVNMKPGAVVGVTGCMAQRLGPQILDKAKHVSVVIGSWRI